MLIAYVVRVIRKHPLRLSVGGERPCPPTAPASAALPPSVREVSWPLAMTEGETGEVEFCPYAPPTDNLCVIHPAA